MYRDGIIRRTNIFRLRQKLAKNFNKTFGGGSDATAKPQQRINTINHNQFPVVASKENNLLGNALNQNGGYLYKKLMENPGINTPFDKIVLLLFILMVLLACLHLQ